MQLEISGTKVLVQKHWYKSLAAYMLGRVEHERKDGTDASVISSSYTRLGLTVYFPVKVSHIILRYIADVDNRMAGREHGLSSSWVATFSSD